MSFGRDSIERISDICLVIVNKFVFLQMFIVKRQNGVVEE